MVTKPTNLWGVRVGAALALLGFGAMISSGFLPWAYVTSGSMAIESWRGMEHTTQGVGAHYRPATDGGGGDYVLLLMGLPVFGLIWSIELVSMRQKSAGFATTRDITPPIGMAILAAVSFLPVLNQLSYVHEPGLKLDYGPLVAALGLGIAFYGGVLAYLLDSIHDRSTS